MGILLWVGRRLAGFLTTPSRAPYANAPTCPEVLSRIIRPGDVLHIRHHSLFTPRDFDDSSCFAIVKPTVEGGFDHRSQSWDDRTPQLVGTAA